jgi:polyphosphate kinase
MSIDPATASGYRHFSPAGVQTFNKPVTVHFPRERAHVSTSATVWPNLPDRCFGADRQLPEWLIRPWLLLQDAAQRRRPLVERLADLTQVAQALDDLFAVHLPAEADWFKSEEAAGLSISEHIPRWVDELVAEATTLFMHQMRPELVAEGIFVRSVAQLDDWQRDWLHQHFMQRIYPLLTPLAVDPGRPFPYISSDSLNLLVELHRIEGVRGGHLVDRNSLFARVKVPRATPRLVAVPSALANDFAPTVYVCSADLVRFYVHHLFPGMPVRHVYLFRVVRGERPLPGAASVNPTRLRRQEDKPVVRLDVEQRMGAPVLNWLMEHLHLPQYALAQHDRLFDWSCLSDLVALVEQEKHRSQPSSLS